MEHALSKRSRERCKRSTNDGPLGALEHRRVVDDPGS